MKFFDSPNLIREATATTQLAILSELLCILGAEVDYFDSSPDELAVGSSPDELAVDVRTCRLCDLLYLLVRGIRKHSR